MKEDRGRRKTEGNKTGKGERLRNKGERRKVAQKKTEEE